MKTQLIHHRVNSYFEHPEFAFDEFDKVAIATAVVTVADSRTGSQTSRVDHLFFPWCQQHSDICLDTRQFEPILSCYPCFEVKEPELTSTMDVDRVFSTQNSAFRLGDLGISRHDHVATSVQQVPVCKITH